MKNSYLEPDFIDGCFLTNKNDFKDSEDFKKIDSKNKANIKIGDLVKVLQKSQYCGMVECVFKFNGNTYTGVKSGKDNDSPAVMVFEISEKKFKGFVVKFESIKKMENQISLKGNSKIIDVSKSSYIVEIDKEKKQFIFIKTEPLKDSNGKLVLPDYGKIVERVEINTVNCVKISQIVPYSKDQVYVRVSDVEIIEHSEDVIKYYKNVIIIPESILEIETVETEFKINDLVNFEDTDGFRYQGKVHWSGKVNQKKAAIIILNSSNDNIEQYKISGNFRDENLFQEVNRGVFVGQYVLKKDVITYITCTKTKLEVLDPNYSYPFERIEHTEKMLIFNFENIIYSLILKWKGFIYNQCCIGCQMNCESDQGTEGKYGIEQLFQCPMKKGIVLSADKVNSNNINGICEFGTHRELKLITTKNGYKVYNKNFICCIEKRDNISENPKLKVGCKIEFENKVVGVCAFLGKVNGNSTVGVNMDNTEINGNSSILDHIRAFSFATDKYDFMDSNDVTVGSYYKTCDSDDASHKIDSQCRYYPNNNRSELPLTGTLKWIGKYRANTPVCGLCLDDEYSVGQNPYFLEPNLFQHEEKHGIIDDIFKIECFGEFSSTESCFCMPESIQQPDKSKLVDILLDNLFKERSDMDMLNICNEVDNAFGDKKMSNFIKKYLCQIKVNELPGVLQLLYRKADIEMIIDIISNYEKINLLLPNLLQFLSKCINDEKYAILENILSKSVTTETDDNIDLICLQLGVKCLQNTNANNFDDRIKLFRSFIGKCIDRNRVFGDSENPHETFLTQIILDGSISDETVNAVLESNFFDINRKDSNGNSPLKLVIKHCKHVILEKLLSMNCDKQDLSTFYTNLTSDCSYNENKFKTMKLITDEFIPPSSVPDIPSMIIDKSSS